MTGNKITSAWFNEAKGFITIEVLISPKASKNKIVGLHDNRLKIRIAAPPVDGKANQELIRFLSNVLGIPTYDIEIDAGHTNKRKTVKISGVTKEAIGKLAETE